MITVTSLLTSLKSCQFLCTLQVVLNIFVMNRTRILPRMRMGHPIHIWGTPYAYGADHLPHTHMGRPYAYGTALLSVLATWV